MRRSFAALIACVVPLSLVHCKKTPPTTPVTAATPTVAAQSVDARASVAPSDASAPPPQDAGAMGDGGDGGDGEGPPVRWLATRAFVQPTAEDASDAGDAGDGSAQAGPPLDEIAQLVRTDDGYIGVSTYWDEYERRHPIVARRYDSDGRPHERIATLAQYTGVLAELSASASGRHLWVLWRADHRTDSGVDDVKMLAVHAETDLQRAAPSIMVRQRNRRRDEQSIFVVGIDARDDGGAHTLLSLNSRPAPEPDRILMTSEDDVIDELTMESVAIDPWHRTSSTARWTQIVRELDCDGQPGPHVMFFHHRGAVLETHSLGCHSTLERTTTELGSHLFAWQSLMSIPIETWSTLALIDGRFFGLHFNQRPRQLETIERSIVDAPTDAGVLEIPPSRRVMHGAPSLRCDNGQLALVASAPDVRVALTGPNVEADLAMTAGALLGLDPESLRPRTMQWTGTKLLYLPDARALFAPSLASWRCEAGALVRE